MKDWQKKLKRVGFDDPSFDDIWKPTEVFEALHLSCKFFSGQWEDEKIYGKVGQPLLVLCNHPDNTSKVEGNCNIVRCPLLAKNVS